MAKYVRALPPQELSKEEYVVESPNFFEEINKLKGKIPRGGHLTINFVRDLVSLAASKYTNTNFNPMHINVSKMKNIPFENLSDLNTKVINFLYKECPTLVDGYVDYHIKHRPFGTKLIYFQGDHLYTNSFSLNGIDEIKEKEVDVYLGKKKKKIIGKPAVTDSE